MESEGSDNEFWQEIDLDSQTNKKNNLGSFNSNLISALTSQINKNINKEPQGERTLKDFYEEKIARIRESKDEEIRQSIIVNTKNIKRDYQNSILILKRRHKEIVDKLKGEVFSLNNIIKTRDFQISNLTKIVTDTENLVTNARIVDLQSKKQQKNPDKPLNEQFYLEHISKLSDQVLTLKEVCNIYKNELDLVGGKFSAEREAFKESENLLKQEILKLKKTIKNRDFEFEARIKMFHNEFENYKNEINLEHQAKDEVVDRQKNHIDGLKDELKNAKLVLQNRKLRNRYYEKLDDYVKENDKKHRKNYTEVNPKIIFSNKENKKKLILHNRRKSDLHSPISVALSNKGSAHYFSFDFSLLN